MSYADVELGRVPRVIARSSRSVGESTCAPGVAGSVCGETFEGYCVCISASGFV